MLSSQECMYLAFRPADVLPVTAVACSSLVIHTECLADRVTRLGEVLTPFMILFPVSWLPQLRPFGHGAFPH